MLPLKLTTFGPPHITGEATSALAVTPVTMADGGAMTGIPFRLPAVVTTLADTQQKLPGLYGSRTYHQLESSFRPAIWAVPPRATELMDGLLKSGPERQLTPADIGVTWGTLGVGTMVAVGVIVGTAVKVAGIEVAVPGGITPAVVGVGDGDWLAGANVGKLQANIKLTDANKAMIL